MKNKKLVIPSKQNFYGVKSEEFVIFDHFAA